jgi:uncharacterized Fe-S center protein
MPANVYFTPLGEAAETTDIQKISRILLETVIEREKVGLAAQIPLKVHCGEHKNLTYLIPENYFGIIDFLKEGNIPTFAYAEQIGLGATRYHLDEMG